MQAIVGIVIALIVAGFVLWAVRQLVALIPMDAWIKSIVDTLILILVAAIIVFYVVIPLIHLLVAYMPAHL